VNVDDGGQSVHPDCVAEPPRRWSIRLEGVDLAIAALGAAGGEREETKVRPDVNDDIAGPYQAFDEEARTVFELAAIDQACEHEIVGGRAEHPAHRRLDQDVAISGWYRNPGRISSNVTDLGAQNPDLLRHLREKKAP
jgi:hypothetical protein